MGMDVIGSAPTAPVGEYFRNNIWWWHPLAGYLIATYPALTAPCECWATNDGDGLDAAQSLALYEAVQRDLDTGKVDREAARFAHQAGRDGPMRFSKQNVAEFAAFLRHCGGFAIW